MRTRVTLLLVLAVVLAFSGIGFAAVTPPAPPKVIVPATVDYDSLPAFTTARSCMIRLFVDEIYSGRKGEVAWILQNSTNETFEGDVVIGNATQHVVLAPGAPFSVNNSVNISESGSFTLTFWLKDGMAVDMNNFCATLWNGAWNVSFVN
jgi:hypothetical protein